MEDLGESLGLTWCLPQERDQVVWLPDIGLATIALRFTYSAGAGQHVELLEGAPGSIWDGRESPGLHHVGLWSDDVRRDTEAMVARGCSVLLGQRPPEEGYGAFTYVQPPSGLVVEFVTTAVRPMFERWFAGGALA
jgi:catechol 2,3-dioxygenase-like lactoylglutathione lyase family enzyme